MYTGPYFCSCVCTCVCTWDLSIHCTILYIPALYIVCGVCICDNRPCKPNMYVCTERECVVNKMLSIPDWIMCSEDRTIRIVLNLSTTQKPVSMSLYISSLFLLGDVQICCISEILVLALGAVCYVLNLC